MTALLALRLVGRRVSRLAGAQAFYTSALGFQAVETGATAARLRLGEQEIELVAAPRAPYPPDSSAADLWFQHIAVIVTDIAAAAARVLAHGGTPISHGGPQILPASAGGVTAFKFRDPEGHPVELLGYPPDRIPAYWQRHGAGYDHAAISVADAGRSIAFYERLGMKCVARQVNRGPAQAALDGLDPVEVEVVALQPARQATPHLELLSYRTPRGRPVPAAQTAAADTLIFTVAPGNDAEMQDPDGHGLSLRSAPA